MSLLELVSSSGLHNTHYIAVTGLVPNGLAVTAYGVGDNPVFHPYLGRVPLKRVGRTPPPPKLSQPKKPDPGGLQY